MKGSSNLRKMSNVQHCFTYKPVLYDRIRITPLFMGSEVKLPSIQDLAATASVRLYLEPPAVSRTDHAMQKLIWITEI